MCHAVKLHVSFHLAPRQRFRNAKKHTHTHTLSKCPPHMPVKERTGPNLKPTSPGVTLASTGALCRIGCLMWGALGGRGKSALGERKQRCSAVPKHTRPSCLQLRPEKTQRCGGPHANSRPSLMCLDEGERCRVLKDYRKK